MEKRKDVDVNTTALHFTLFLFCDLMRATIGCIRSNMAKEKQTGLKLIFSYQLETNLCCVQIWILTIMMELGS